MTVHLETKHYVVPRLLVLLGLFACDLTRGALHSRKTLFCICHTANGKYHLLDWYGVIAE